MLVYWLFWQFYNYSLRQKHTFRQEEMTVLQERWKLFAVGNKVRAVSCLPAIALRWTNKLNFLLLCTKTTGYKQVAWRYESKDCCWARCPTRKGSRKGRQNTFTAYLWFRLKSMPGPRVPRPVWVLLWN